MGGETYYSVYNRTPFTTTTPNNCAVIYVYYYTVTIVYSVHHNSEGSWTIYKYNVNMLIIITYYVDLHVY